MGCNCGKKRPSFAAQRRQVPATLPSNSGPTAVQFADGTRRTYPTKLEALAAQVLNPGASVIETD